LTWGPGGAWRFVLHGPDGKDYKNKIIYQEIVKPARIVFEHVSDPKFQATAALAEDGGGIRLTFRMLFDTTAECEQIVKYGVEAELWPARGAPG